MRAGVAREKGRSKNRLLRKVKTSVCKARSAAREQVHAATKDIPRESRHKAAAALGLTDDRKLRTCFDMTSVI
jgi:hypothetical protein